MAKSLCSYTKGTLAQRFSQLGNKELVGLQGGLETTLLLQDWEFKAL